MTPKLEALISEVEAELQAGKVSKSFDNADDFLSDPTKRKDYMFVTYLCSSGLEELLPHLYQEKKALELWRKTSNNSTVGLWGKATYF
jgi:hypothetical protein